MPEQCLFEIRQHGIAVAAITGPRGDAVNEALHYARQYEQEGPVEVVEVLTLYRTPGAGERDGEG